MKENSKMWSFSTFTQWFSTAMHYLTGLGITTIALICLIGAGALYVYSIFDVRIPKIIVTPLVAILIFAGAWLYSKEETTSYQESLCDIRFNTAQQTANDKQLEAAVKIQGLEKILSNTLVQMAQVQASDKQDLQQAIEDSLQHPSKDQLPLLIAPTPIAPETGKDNAIPQPPEIYTDPRETVVASNASSCLAVSVPANIVSIIQRSNPTSIKSGK